MRFLFCLFILLFSLTTHAQSYYLLVGTYTNMGSTTAAPPKDSTGSKGIYVYTFNGATGHTELLSQTAAVNPSYLDIAPDGIHVYACTESRTMNAGSISAFLLDREKGTLQLVNKVPSGGDNPVYVSVHRSGRWAVVANYSGGSLSVFPIRGDGAVLPYVQHIQHTGHSVIPERQDKPHVHSVVFSPDNRSLYTQDLGEDVVSIYGFNSAEKAPLGTAGGSAANGADQPAANGADQPAATGADQPAASAANKIATPPGSGPRHLTFHPNGKYAYLVEEMGGCVDVYRYYPGMGRLDSLQRIPSHVADNPGPFRGSDVHVSADGRFLYVTNREKESSITIFAIDSDKGTLRTVGYQPVLGKEPRNFMLDPTGQFLLVANQDSNEVVIFRVDQQTGLLQPTGQRLKVPSPSCLKMVK